MKNRNFVNLNMNPCKMCMPIGAVIAIRGIEKSMSLLHGSQGCTAYMRTHLTTHFSEPMDIGSSSLHESATIYGGSGNLKKGLRNMIRLYAPKVIGVATTCLAETIGEDIGRAVNEFKMEPGIPGGMHFITVNTPSYGGTLHEGYFAALHATVKQTAAKTAGHGKINVIMPHVSPGDVRNIKSIMGDFGLDCVFLPDISNTFDAPFHQTFKRMPEGGTRLCDIEKMAGARATIEMGVTVPETLSPGKYLNDTFGVPLFRTPVPLGLENTDAFFKILVELSGRALPEKYREERGRMIDGMIDSHKVNGGIRALVYGEPDLVYSVSRLCFENGIFPAVISTGSHSTLLLKLLDENIKRTDRQPVMIDDTDFETIEQHALEKGVHLVIGNSMSKHLTERHGIPPVRIGFPIQDRFGGQRLVYTGYNGSMKLLDDITNAMLPKKFGMHRIEMLAKYRNSAA